MKGLSESNQAALAAIIEEIAGVAADKVTCKLTFECDLSQGTIISVGFTEAKPIYRVNKGRKIRSPGI